MIYKLEEYTIANNTTVTLDVATTVGYYVFSGSATLSTGDYIVTTSTTPSAGLTFYIWWKANATYTSTNNVSILGTALTQEQANTDMLITVKGINGTDWDVLVPYTTTPDMYKGVGEYEIDTAGETKTFVNTIDDRVQRVTGTGTLTGDTTITADTGKDGDEMTILYRATMTLDTFNIAIFGIDLSVDEALSGDLVISAIWSDVVGAWVASMYKGQTLVPDKATQALAEAGSNNLTYNTPLRTAQYVAAWLLAGAKSTSQVWTYTNAAPIVLSNAAFTANYTLELDGSKQVVSIAKATGYNLALGTTAGTVMEGDDSRVINQQFVQYASFEATEVGDLDMTLTFDAVLTSAVIRVTRTLANTDAGTITLSNGPNPITGGAQVIPLSTAFGTEYTLTLSGADATFQVGDVFRINTAKTTAGGRVQVVTYFTRST